MALISPQTIDIDGLEATYAACSGGGDTVRADGRTCVHVKNGHSAPQTVTVVRPGSTYGQANPDIPIVVTNAEERFIGPFPADLGDTDGLVHLTYSGVTALTIAALRL